MKRADARLELLKLCHRHDHQPMEIIARMKELENYIFEGEKSESVGETEAPKKRGRPPKKDANPDILS